jgi:hypothetical protein
MGTLGVKWQELDFRVLLSSALQHRGMPQQEYLLGKPLSNATQMVITAIRKQRLDATNSGLWQSAHYVRRLTVAIRGASIFLVAACEDRTADCQGSR